MGTGNIVEEFTLTIHGRIGGTCALCLPGDVIVGRLNLAILQHIPLTSITITVRGRGFVHWTNQKLRGAGEPRFKDTHHHSAAEDYMEQTLVLYGDTKKDRPEKCYLPAGRYTYPFRCELPPRLPCSFEGEYGYVRYWVKATIEKGRQILHKTKVPFSVLAPLDLNTIPESNKPVQESTEKDMCCFCCLSGPISASLCLPKRGYVPGEPIRFGAEVSNLSSRRLGCCSVELKMTTLFKTETDYRCTTQQICKVRRDQKISKGEEVTWYCDQLVVPPIPPSCLIGCSIISIKYTLELRVDPLGPAFDLTLPLEVIIGTVPHRISRPDQHYANVHCPINERAHGRHGNPAHVHRPPHAGVPVLPVLPPPPPDAGNGTVAPPTPPVVPVAPIPHPGNPQNAGNPEAHGYYACPDRVSEHRPSSRASSASSAPSTASTACSKRVSVMFAQQVTRRRKLKFGDDSDQSTGSIKFTPFYPFYQWR